MKISVIIPCKNEETVVIGLLDSLARQTRMLDEVIVVDSHSTDGTVAAALQYEQQLHIKIVTASKRGLAEARNAGLAASSNELIFFMDADVQLNPNFLADALGEIERRKLDTGGFTQRMPSKKAGLRVGARLMNGYSRTMQHTPWPIAFSCMFARKHVAQKLNGFDPTLFIMEDYDFMLRARRASYKVGIVNVPFIASDRRFIEKDALPVWWNVYGELYRYTHGMRVTKQIYTYRMGGKEDG